MNGSLPKQEPARHDFSKIRSYMALPNLIDVQSKSYDRFLQMNLLPEEREDDGLQSVFTSVFPFSDFRETCSLDFVKYSIGNWECKCGTLKGLEHLRMTCANCGFKIITDLPTKKRFTARSAVWSTRTASSLRHLRQPRRSADEVLTWTNARSGA